MSRKINKGTLLLLPFHYIEKGCFVEGQVTKGFFFSSQVEACNREAQKIEAFVNTATPSFTSDIVLSALKGARSRVPSLSSKPDKPVPTSHKSKGSRVNNALIATVLPIIMLPVMLRTGRS